MRIDGGGGDVGWWWEEIFFLGMSCLFVVCECVACYNSYFELSALQFFLAKQNKNIGRKKVIWRRSGGRFISGFNWAKAGGVFILHEKQKRKGANKRRRRKIKKASLSCCVFTVCGASQRSPKGRWITTSLSLSLYRVCVCVCVCDAAFWP